MSYMLDKKMEKEIVEILSENFSDTFQVCRATLEIYHSKTRR